MKRHHCAPASLLVVPSIVSGVNNGVPRRIFGRRVWAHQALFWAALAAWAVWGLVLGLGTWEGAIVIWALYGLLQAANAVAVSRLKSRGEWNEPDARLLPPAQPDEAYLVTLHRWLRSRRAS